jgi:hypothetical protein
VYTSTTSPRQLQGPAVDVEGDAADHGDNRNLASGIPDLERLATDGRGLE